MVGIGFSGVDVSEGVGVYVGVEVSLGTTMAVDVGVGGSNVGVVVIVKMGVLVGNRTIRWIFFSACPPRVL